MYDNSKWIALGNGSNNTLAYSYDSINWFGLGKTIFSVQGKKALYNGTIWVAVGEGTNTVAYSNDGIEWTGLGSSIFSVKGNDIAWNGIMWIIVGKGTNGVIARSYDGINWTMNKTNDPFVEEGTAIAYKNNIWVAGGSAISSSTTFNTLSYSYDGISWTGLGKTIFTWKVNNINWVNNKFYACGQGLNTVATSANGISWTAKGTSLLEVKSKLKAKVKGDDQAYWLPPASGAPAAGGKGGAGQAAPSSPYTSHLMLKRKLSKLMTDWIF